MKKMDILSTIFINTFAKEYRHKTLYFITAISLLMLLTMAYFSGDRLQMLGIPMSAGEFENKKLEVFFTFLLSFGYLLSILLGTHSVKSDFDDHVAHLYLSLPIKKEEYLAARILGTVALIFSYFLISLVLAVLVFSVVSGHMVFEMKLVKSLLFELPSLFVFVTGSMIFSLIFPKMISMIGSFILFWICHRATMVYTSFDFEVNPLHKLAVGHLALIPKILWWVFPHTAYFEHFSRASLEVPLETVAIMAPWWQHSLHFVFSYGLMVFLLFMIFRRKELNF